MSFEDLGNLGDLIGGIAVVVTLVYLAVQVRHNTRAVSTSSYLQLTENIHQAWQPLVDHTTADVYARGLVSYRSLSFPEQLTFSTILSGYLARFDEALLLEDQGLIGPGARTSMQTMIGSLMKLPGVIEWWSDVRHLYDRRVQIALDSETAV